MDNVQAGRDEPFAPLRARGPDAPRPKFDETWTPALPAGHELPDLGTIRFPGWGTASRAFRYLDATGTLLFAVLRFEKTDATGAVQKQTLPYVYGYRRWIPRSRTEPIEKTGWHFKSLPGARPLYGLDRLADASELVCVCEGEKAADAAQDLWPDVACISSSGGSNAVRQTDWTPIAGRDVVIWPDQDEAGQAYAASVVQACEAAGAASVRVVPVDPAWPAGWDLADDLPDGVTVEALRDLLFREPKPEPVAEEPAAAEPEPNFEDLIETLSRYDRTGYAVARRAAARSAGVGVGELDKLVKLRIQARMSAERTAQRLGPPPKPGEVRWPFGYEMRPDGLHFEGSGDGGSSWLCAPLEVLGEGRDSDGEGWALFLRWHDADRREHTWPMPKKLLAGTGSELESALQDRGLRIAGDTQSRTSLRRALAEVQAGSRVRLVDRPGWHMPTGEPAVFVLPTGDVVGEAAETIVLRSMSENAHGMIAEAGTLEGWQASVARYAVGNPLPAFLICAGFAGPLLQLLGQVSGGFHIQGRSKIGKTLGARMGVSVWGPTRTGGLYRDWRSTANGLEAAAEESSGSMLFLDEIHQAEPREVVGAVYMLGNEQGKARMTKDIVSRRRKNWQTIVISTGETDVAGMAAKANVPMTAGAEVRIPSLPATMAAMWPELHGFVDARWLMTAVNDGMVRHHGTAIGAFLERLVAEQNENPDRIHTRFDDTKREVSRDLQDDADVQVHEVARRCAVFAMAGELAIDWGILPWPPGEAEAAASAALRLWIGKRGSQSATEDTQHVTAIRTFLVQFGASRFEGLERSGLSSSWTPIDTIRQPLNRAGFRRRQTDSRFEYLIDPDVWPSICQEAGVDPHDCAKTLAAAGFLDRGEGKNLAKTQRTPAGKSRYFTIRPELVGDGEDEPEPRPASRGMPQFEDGYPVGRWEE